MTELALAVPLPVGERSEQSRSVRPVCSHSRTIARVRPGRVPQLGRAIALTRTVAGYEVLVLDDDPLVRAWLRSALRTTEFRLAAEAATPAEAQSLLERRKIDLLLVDLRLDRDLGTDFIRRLRVAGNDQPIVLMTSAAQRGANEQAHEAGAQASIVKSADRDELLTCLRAVAAGGSVFDPSHPPRASDDRPLTRREREILALLADGRTNPEIAEQLGLGVESVKTYVERIFGKLGVRRRTEVAAAARRRGWLG